MLIKLKNTEIKIDFSFILVLSFVCLFEYKQSFYVILFSSLHEVGHLIALYLCRGKAKRLTLSFYGFGLSFDDNLTKEKDLIVYIAGPLVNFVLYFILKDEINLLLFILNMLPIYPLDMGRVISLFLPHSVVKIISIIFLLVLILISLYFLIAFGAFSLLFITIYLIVSNVRYL